MLSATHSIDSFRPPIPLLRPQDKPSSHWLPGARVMTHLLDVVDYGVVLATGDGRPLFANRAAGDWLVTGQPLCIRHNELTTGTADRAAAFSVALRDAAQRGTQTLLSFDQMVGDRACVSVVPLPDAAETPVVLLLLSRRHDSQALCQDAYARRLCLTAAQTRVMKLLCAGVKPPEIARRLAVKLTTVRTHIGAIREKTGTHDTAGIIHQVARLPPLPCVLRPSHSFLMMRRQHGCQTLNNHVEEPVMRLLACSWICFLAGCSGLEMRTLQAEQVQNARKAGGQPLNGYVVYEPVVVVELSNVCMGQKNDSGGCKDQTLLRCAAGKPFLLPDYDKPYLVASKSGFGQAGVELTIVDGWRLGQAKDASDNSAALGLLGKAAGIPTLMALEAPAAPGAPSGCKSPGLYRVKLEKDGIRLTDLQLY